MPTYITPKFPLTMTEEGYYEYEAVSDNLNFVISQNLKNIFMTNPGELLLEPEFGVGFERYLFEQPGTFESELRTNIFDQVSKYAPYVTIEELNLIITDELLSVKMIYMIDETRTFEEYSLEIPIPL